MALREILVNALISKYEAQIAEHTANIAVFLESGVGVAEHPGTVETLDAEVSKLGIEFLVSRFGFKVGLSSVSPTLLSASIFLKIALLTLGLMCFASKALISRSKPHSQLISDQYW